MTSTLNGRAVTLIALMCMCATLREAHSALIISGPSAGAPGTELILSVALDAPLADADELTLTLDFDPALLQGTDATEGALLAGNSFTANPAAGSAVTSFLTTQLGLGPGIVATWKFKIDAGALASTQTVVVAHLETSIIDNDPTGNVSSDPFTIRVIPEPSLGALLAAGLALIGCARRLERRR